MQVLMFLGYHYMGISTKDISVYVSASSLPVGDPGWTKVGDYTLSQGVLDETIDYSDLIRFTATSAVQYVQIHIISNYGGSFAGLAEVEFSGVGISTPLKSIWNNVSDYTYIWWAYGLRDASKVFNIQTSRYGLSFDFDNFTLNTFGQLTAPVKEEDALTQNNDLVNGLPAAGIECVVEQSGLRYKAIGAGPSTGNCRLFENGKYFQRRQIDNVA